MNTAENARAYTAALRQGVHSRPVQADQLPDPTLVKSARHRSAQGHWVAELQESDEAFAVALPAADLIDVGSRTSQLAASEAPLPASTALLQLMANTRQTQNDTAGRVWSSRTSPSAGGTHSIRPLLFTGSGWLRAEPSNRLQPVRVRQSETLLAAVSDAANTDVRTALFGVSEPDIILARYLDGVSLLWRDAGAFFATAQFAAAGYGLLSRIIGITIELDSADRFVPAFAVGAVVLTGQEVT